MAVRLSITVAALISLVLLCHAYQGTNHYVRAGAGGTADGSDWANAWTALPATLTRGDTYYIADGSYAAYAFNDAVSGTDAINIKKATASSHGTETGWETGYGDGQAVFAGMTITTDYWLIDGQSRTTWISGHGLKVSRSGNPGRGIDIGGDHITVQYVEIEGNGPDDAGTPADDGIYAIADQEALQFRYLYIHDQGRAPFILRGLDNAVTEYCFVARNESHTDQHSEAVSLFDRTCDNNTFRYNIFEDIEGTGTIVVGNGTGNAYYGNLIYWTANYPNTGQGGGYNSNGSITSWDAETQNNFVAYNNTVILPASGGINFAVTNQGAGTGNIAQNNLYFCAGSIGTRITYVAGTSHDYNSYSGATAQGEAHGQSGISSGLFSNATTYDFRLALDTDAWNPLGSPYALDLLGAARTSSRGAYQYQAPPPAFSTIQGGSSVTAGNVRQ